MFSVIRSNRRKSLVLIAGMGLALAGSGYLVGALLDPAFGPIGVLVAAAVWALLLAASWAGGEQMLLAQAGGREVRKMDAPQLFNIVEEMQLAAGLSRMPKVFIMDTPIPNAFAVGRNDERAAVGVTTGLLARLNRDELQGVIAHEIAHIKHRDTLFMTIAATTLGAIVMLSDFFVRGLRFHVGGPRRSGNGRNDQGAALLTLVAVVMAVVAPLLAQLLYFACSRRREYLADAGAAQFTRYPEGLASALEKIAGGQKPGAETSRVLAPLYIVSPHAARGSAGSWLSTHPPTEDRVRVLRAMSGSASLKAYAAAYQRLHGGQTIAELVAGPTADTPTRPPASPAPPPLPAGWRDARASLHALEGARAIECPCGLRLRIPPTWQGASIACPRCGHRHTV